MALTARPWVFMAKRLRPWKSMLWNRQHWQSNKEIQGESRTFKQVGGEQDKHEQRNTAHLMFLLMQCQLQLLHQKQCRPIILVDWIWYLAGKPKQLFEHLVRMICTWRMQQWHYAYGTSHKHNNCWAQTALWFHHGLNQTVQYVDSAWLVDMRDVREQRKQNTCKVVIMCVKCMHMLISMFMHQL